MIPQLEIILIASVVAIACSLVGVFLVLRKISLMSDAISHSILLGIVLAFFVVEDISSPLLIIGAGLVGILTVFLTEAIIRTRKIKEDASIGLVFPFLFSIGVILITKFAGSIHLDTDAVLLGEIAFAPFDRFILFGHDIAPKSLVVMSIILIVNLLFILLYYKELKLSTFDAALATTLGFSPVLLHYLLMVLVSITAVGAFDAVGSILVVALMIAPASTAYLVTNKLSKIFFLSAITGVVSAVLGYIVAKVFNGSIAGAMVIVMGLLFLLALLFSPSRGLIMKIRLYLRKKREFAGELLVVHLLDHEGSTEEKTENTVSHSQGHMNWSESFSHKIVRDVISKSWISQKGDRLFLTDLGREVAREVMVRT